MAIESSYSLDTAFHALGDQTRREILEQLVLRGASSAGEIGSHFESAQPTISKHLKVLEKAGLVERRITGRRHIFAVGALPLLEAETWLSRHRAMWEGNLDRLDHYLEDTVGSGGENE